MSETSYTRWQGRSIEQLRSSSHLVLALSLSALAFSATLLKSEVTMSGIESILFHLQAALFLVSILSGAALDVNRTLDFRLTARIARAREKNREDEALPGLRKRSRSLGNRSLCLYKTQLIGFAAGSTLWVLFILFHFAEALYGAGPATSGS